jgi:hypothetical protein
VILGWILIAIGLVTLLWPRLLVSIAPYYRGTMPSGSTPTAIRSARIGALLVAAAGIGVVLTG